MPQKPHPAVVRIIAPEEGGTSFGSGTLVDVHGDYGLVLTNWHVVADATHTIRGHSFPMASATAARGRDHDRNRTYADPGGRSGGLAADRSSQVQHGLAAARL